MGIQTYDDIPLTVSDDDPLPLVVLTSSATTAALKVAGMILRRSSYGLLVEAPHGPFIFGAALVSIPDGYAAVASLGNLVNDILDLPAGKKRDARYPAVESARRTGRVATQLNGVDIDVQVKRARQGGGPIETQVIFAIRGDLTQEWSQALLFTLPVIAVGVQLLAECNQITKAVDRVFARALIKPSRDRVGERLETVKSTFEIGEKALGVVRDLGLA